MKPPASVHRRRTPDFGLAGSISVLLLTIASLAGDASSQGHGQGQTHLGIASKADAPVYLRSLSRFGITWTFDRNYPTGTFANGDQWVIGPVSITAISPPSVSGQRVLNGSMVNPPVHSYEQGYDSSMYGPHDAGYYRPELNVALDVSASTPLLLAPGSSLLSTISMDAAGSEPQIRTAAVLTCLATTAPLGTFRPAYAGKDKTLRFNKSQLRHGLLRRLPAVANTPSLASVAARFERPWLDYIHSWMAQYQHPNDNMPFYGREIATDVGVAALMLHLDFTSAEKEELLVRFVQLGIDYHGVVLAGGTEVWPPNGGHASGRKWPILFAGLMLGDTDMAGIGGRLDVMFGEDGQTFYVAETSPGVFNYGYGGYALQDVGLAEWGYGHSVSPVDDDRRWTADPYRRCCTANAWAGFVLAARIMGQRSAWNHDVLFDYMDRYMQTETDPSWRQWEPWAATMWDTYRRAY